jgi:hypothetical protein
MRQHRLVLALGVVAALIIAFAITAGVGFSTGGGIRLGPVRQVGPPPRVTPEIVRFDVPTVVRCSKAGAAVKVKYEYATLNASVVNGRIDGVRRGVQRVGGPARGTLRFRYVCPGPHTLAITARSSSGLTASASIRFNKKNHAVSATASRAVIASP